jgi:hypothetical protein
LRNGQHGPENSRNSHLQDGPKRLPDRQTGQLSFVLGGQYPITDYYVNLKLVFGQSWTLAPAGARGFYVNWL